MQTFLTPQNRMRPKIHWPFSLHPAISKSLKRALIQHRLPSFKMPIHPPRLTNISHDELGMKTIELRQPTTSTPSLKKAFQRVILRANTHTFTLNRDPPGWSTCVRFQRTVIPSIEYNVLVQDACKVA